MVSWCLAKEHPMQPRLLHNIDLLVGRFIRRAQQAGKSFGQMIDPDATFIAVHAALEGEHPELQAVVLGDTHILLYSLARPWWSCETWLIEQFYGRIAKGQSDPLGSLDFFAGDHLGVSKIVFGTTLANDAALGRLLAQSGYTQQSTQYIKEL